jgi:YD repeat-containing protein
VLAVITFIKCILLAILFNLTAFTIAFGQDKDLERKFYSARSRFKAAKIKKMTERVSWYWLRPCIKDSAEIKFRYEFNKNGDLIRIDEFYRGFYWKSTNYWRNSKGDYTEKRYTFYDSVGNITRRDNWMLQFNKKGRRDLEIWLSSEDTIRINNLSYDKRGNCVEQFTDGWIQWRFTYDRNNRLVGSNHCRLVIDSMQCHSLTKFFYENSLLKRQVTYSKTNDIWKESDYSYDSKRTLVQIKERWHTLVKQNDEPWKEEIHTITTVFDNDPNGNCIVKSEFNGDEESPFRCTYYDYEYY